MTTTEMNMLYDGFKSLKGMGKIGKNLADKIIKAAYLQSGLNATRTSFLNTIPGDDLMELFKDVLDQAEDGYGSLEQASSLYYSKFFRNNSEDFIIVPHSDDANAKNLDFNFKYSKESVDARVKAIEEGTLPLPKLQKLLYNRIETETLRDAGKGKKSITKYGSLTLENYYLGSETKIPENLGVEQPSDPDIVANPGESTILPDEEC